MQLITNVVQSCFSQIKVQIPAYPFQQVDPLFCLLPSENEIKSIRKRQTTASWT